MGSHGSALSSGHSSRTGLTITTAESVFAIVLAMAYFAISVPFPELVVIYAPQLLTLVLLALVLTFLDARATGTRTRALVAVGTALALAVPGVAFLLQPSIVQGMGWILCLPYALGAGLAGGLWVARRGTRLSHLLLRVYEGATAPMVAYALLGIILVTVRS